MEIVLNIIQCTVSYFLAYNGSGRPLLLSKFNEFIRMKVHGTRSDSVMYYLMEAEYIFRYFKVIHKLKYK